MEITVKKLENAAMEMEITVEKVRFDAEYKKTLNKVQKTASVDGFRKGKAPLNILEVKFKETIEHETIEEVLKNSYFDAIKEKELHPISMPQFDVDKIDVKNDFKFKVIFDVAPTVELGNFKGLSADKKNYEISDLDILEELDRLRDERAVVTKKDYPDADVQNGDLASIELKRIDNIDESIIPTTEYRPFTLIVGKSKEEYAFDSHIIGMKVNDEKEVKIKYPKDYSVKDLANQKATYLVRIKEISKRDLPALDDEFAKDMGEYADLDALKKELRESIEKYIEAKTKAEVAEDLMAQIVEKSTFEIPKSIIESEKQELFGRIQQRTGLQAPSFDDFVNMLGLAKGEFEGKLTDEAVKNIKQSLVLTKIAKKENIQVSEDDFRERITKIAGNQPIEQVEAYIKQNNLQGNIEYDILAEKASDYMINNSKLNEKKALPYKEFIKSQEQQ